MEQRKSSSNSALQAGLGVAFLHALNAAAASLQRSARSEAEVFQAVREQIVGLGLRGGLSLLDDQGEHVTVRAVAQPKAMMKVLTVLEKLVGIKAEGYTFPVAGAAAYRQVVETGEALFMAESSAAVEQLIPEAARPWVGRILDAFGGQPGIFAPLIHEGKVTGILNVVGAGLTPNDLPAMVAFANHIAVALENARLFATLRASEARFRRLLESAPDAIVIVNNDDHRIEFVNAQAEKLFGYSRHELSGQPVEILVPERFRERHTRFRATYRSAPAARAIGTGQDLYGRRKDGSDFYADIMLSPTELDGRLVVLTIIRDITEQLQAEEALRMSEERYRVVAEAASDVIIVIDEDSRIRFINPASRNVFGYTAAELIGESLTLLMPESLQRRHLAAFQRYLESGQRSMDWRTVEVAGRRKDGSEFPLEISFGESASEGKRFLAGVVRDITERKRAEAALAARNEEIKAMSQQFWQTAKLATMGELAASIAHELNNPLATVSLRVEDLLAEIPTDDPKRRPLEVIEQEVERMGTLVANLLQFSRRGAQQISTLDVREEIAKTLELVHYLLRQRRIAVVQDFAPDAPMIQADRQQLRQLFLNLLTNASDAMPDGGTLTIRVGVEAKQVVIEIQDAGLGIAPEDLPKVMEPFFTTKPEGKGTGLGLAICRRIAQEHGGTLDIVSAGSGQGTTVRIVLLAKNNSNGAFLKET